MKNFFRLFFLVFLCFTPILSPFAFAHSGGTDSQGGHNSANGYHYHHGYPAHQHENGICPYNFDDKTGQNSGSSSSGSSDSGQNTSYNSSNAYTEAKSRSHILPVLIFLSVIILFLYWYKLRKDRVADAEERRKEQERILQEQKQKEYEQQEKLRQEREKFEQEKQYYTNIYGGKPIEEFVNIPPHIMIGDDNLPREKTAKEYWGDDLTIFITKNGNKYHRATCQYGNYPYNIYRLSSYYSPCSKCKPIDIPDKSWYNEYLRIQAIKEKYQIK